MYIRDFTKNMSNVLHYKYVEIIWSSTSHITGTIYFLCSEAAEELV